MNKPALEKQIEDLKFKVNVTPWWMGKSIYEKALKNAEYRLWRWTDPAHRLQLCYAHRQESNHSHYSPHNCDHCKLQAKAGIRHEVNRYLDEQLGDTEVKFSDGNSVVNVLGLRLAQAKMDAAVHGAGYLKVLPDGSVENLHPSKLLMCRPEVNNDE